MAAVGGRQTLGSVCSRWLLSFLRQSASQLGHKWPQTAEAETQASPLSPPEVHRTLVGIAVVVANWEATTGSVWLCTLTAEARAALKEASA